MRAMLVVALLAATACGTEPLGGSDLAVGSDIARPARELGWETQPDLRGGQIDLGDLATTKDLAMVTVTEDLAPTGDLAPTVDMARADDLASAPDMVPVCLEPMAMCSPSGTACCGPLTCNNNYDVNGVFVPRCCSSINQPCRFSTDCCRASASIQLVCNANGKCEAL